MPLVGVSPLGPFLAPPLGPSLGPSCLLASYTHAVLIGSSSRLSLGGLLSSRRLIGSPLASYRPAPRSIRQAGRGGANGERSLAGGHRRCADGGERMALAWLLACLGAMNGAARSFLDRFFLPIIGSSNRLGLGSFHHLIISSSHPIDWEEPSFPFRPTPSRLLFSACLLWLVPPSPAGGCNGCGMTCGGGRGGCLLAFSCPVPLTPLPLVRSLLYALRRSCRSFLPRASLGVLWAFLTAILSALAFLKTCP